VLGLVDATCVVIGAIIGVGIFFTPTSVARLTGGADLAMAAWALGGVIALCGALTFAELGARFNAAGAQYDVIRTAWGSLIAFLFVFCISTVIVPGATAIIAIICARYLGAAVGIDLDNIDMASWEAAARSIGWDASPGTFNSAPILTISAALVLGLMAANYLGARFGAVIQNITVYAKVAALLAIAFVAVMWGESAGTREPLTEEAAKLTSGLSPVAAVLAALVPAFFSYGGWQQGLWVSGEVRDPRRNLPRAIIIGVVIVVTVYLLANWAYFRLLGESGVMTTQTLASDAVATVVPKWGARIVAAAVAISSFGVLNVEFLTGPRLTYAMARDGYFFSIFGRLSPVYGTPGPALALLAIATLVLLFAAGENGVNTLLTGVMFVDAVFFVLTGAALFILRWRERRPPVSSSGSNAVNESAIDGERRFRVPLYPWVPAFFVLGEIGVVAGSYLDPATRNAAYIGAIWIVAGALLYFVGFRRR
jgi:APA family basic amino acid/polyamine antiporter